MARERLKRSIDIFVNGESAGKSVGELNGRFRRLRNEIAQLTPGTDAYFKKLDELREVGDKLDEHRKLVRGIDDSYGSLIERLGPLSGLIGGALAGFSVSTIVSGISDVTAEFRDLRGEIELLTGATGEQQDDLAVRISAIATTFDEETDVILKGINALSTEFDISLNEAVDAYEKGLLSAAGQTGEFQDSVLEFSGQVANAGGDVGEFLNILNTSAEEGVFSDKGIDVVKEFNLRIREETDGTREALEGAFGKKFTDDLFKGISDGSKLPIDALKDISKELQNTAIPQERLQTVIADVFGGPGEDAGLRYLQLLSEIDSDTSDLIDTNNELTARQIQVLEDQQALAEEQNELSREIGAVGDIFSDVWTNVKTIVVGALVTVIKFLKENRDTVVGVLKVVATLTAGWLAYRSAIVVSNISQKVFNKSLLENIKNTKLARAVTIASAGAQALFTGNIKRARAALRLFNRVVNTNPLGLFLGAVTALTTAIGLFSGELSTAEKIQQNFIDVQKEANKATAEEKSSLSSLLAIAKDDTIAREKRLKAIEELNRISPEYLGNLTLENVNTQEGIDIIDNYIEALDRKALAQAISNKKSELFQQQLELETKTNEELGASFGALDVLAFTFGSTEENNTRISKARTEAINEQNNALQAQIDALTERQKEAIKAGDIDIGEAIGEQVPAEEIEAPKFKGEPSKELQKQKDKILEQLQSLKDGVQKFEEETAFDATLIDLEEEERLIAEGTKKITDKFQKEIDLAKQLEEEKGKIGEEAGVQRQKLEELRENQIATATLKIRKKFDAQRLDRLEKFEQENAQAVLKARKARADIEVVLAAEAADEAADQELAIQQQADANLVDALINRLELEKNLKLENTELTESERALIEEEFRIQREKIQDESAEKDKARQQQVTQAFIGATQEAFGSLQGFISVLSENRLSEIDQRRTSELEALEARAAAELITQEQLEAGKARINKRFDDIATRAKRRQQVLDKSINVGNAIQNTAVGVTKALGAVPPPANFVLAGLVGAAGALQVATIVAQKKKGGYSVIGPQDGKRYRAGYLGRHSGGMLPGAPSLILASEDGPEYFVPNPLLSNPKVAHHVGIIDAIRTGRQMQDGGFTSPPATVSDTPEDQVAGAEQASGTAGLESEIRRLNNILSGGIVARIEDQTVEGIQDRAQELDEIKQV